MKIHAVIATSRTRATRAILVAVTLAGLVLLPAALSAQTASSARNKDIQFPIPGAPPLTLEMVQKATKFFEWLLDASLTAEQREQFRDSMAQSWLSGKPDEIQSTVNVIQFADQLNSKTAQEREVYRQLLQPKFLAQMRTQPNSILSRWVLNIYESAHKPIAPGNPPLTQQVVDAYAEAVSFMLYQSMGSGFYTADRPFKDALAQPLIARYPQLDAAQQGSMARIPLLWALLQVEWPKTPPQEQQKLREQWRMALQPLVNQAKQASSATQSAPQAGSLDQQVNKEVQKLWVNSLSQSYMTTTTNIILTHRPF
jgi:hypothetical protein